MSILGDGTVDIKYVLCAQRVHLRNVMNRPTVYFFKPQISNYKRHLCPVQPLSYALDNSGLNFF